MDSKELVAALRTALNSPSMDTARGVSHYRYGTTLDVTVNSKGTITLELKQARPDGGYDLTTLVGCTEEV